MITTRELNFNYDKQAAIRSLDLEVPRGAIYGFLGPNGAGKSTTIKLLLGLLHPDSGSISIFGQSLRQGRRMILSSVGALVEAPSLYRELSARENLRTLDLLYHRGKHRIEEVLELVGLSAAAGKKVKRFSMGMKQRLGIAVALFHDPELLILDEPVNGLDPAGIQDMRRLFLHLRAEGKTLFISSHILAEVEKVATHIGIIQEGKLRFQGPVEQLRSASRPRTVLVTSDDQKAGNLLREQGWELPGAGKESLQIAVSEGPDFHRLLSALMNGGIEIYKAEVLNNSLEDLFLELTADTAALSSTAVSSPVPSVI